MINVVFVYKILSSLESNPLQAFVNEEKKVKKYSNLVIEYARGAMPTLILKVG